MSKKIIKVKDFTNKEKCDCSAIATWVYLPGYGGKENIYDCDNCVHRGCSCNHNSTKEDPLYAPEGIEGKDWKWVEKLETEYSTAITREECTWTYIDEKGREYPCCEFSYEKDGFDKE